MRIGVITPEAVHPGYYEATHPATSVRVNFEARQEKANDIKDMVKTGAYDEFGRIRAPYHPEINPNVLSYHYPDDPTSLQRGLRKFLPIFDPIIGGVFDLLKKPHTQSYQDVRQQLQKASQIPSGILIDIKV